MSGEGFDLCARCNSQEVGSKIIWEYRGLSRRCQNCGATIERNYEGTVPTITYMLELTEEELTVIHCLLVFMESKPGPEPFKPEYQAVHRCYRFLYGRVDDALKTAAEKTQRLMEGR